MCNGTAIYYHERFHQSTAASAAIASLYGITAIFARGLGGYLSDTLSETMSMRGRLWAQMICMLVQGSFTILWARMDTVGSSIVVMVVFSILVSVSMGTCYAIVPYIDGPNTGSVSGIVGAGGSVGAVILGNVFRSNQIVQAAERMGMFTIALALLTPLIVIRGYRGLLFGKDEEPRMQPMTLLTPR
jgi:MFS transporter, NNP family, nitrate/nitrite transporter